MFAPWWWFVSVAGVVIVALALLVVVVLTVARRVVDKARPEDLPAILVGLGEVVASLACFLPWGKTRGSSVTEPTPPQGSEASSLPPVTIVTGQLAATLPLNPPAVPGEANR